MKLEIISPEKTLFSGEVSLVTLPGITGKFTILPNHAPIISILAKGLVVYQVGEEKTEVEINGGFIEMKGEAISVCVE